MGCKRCGKYRERDGTEKDGGRGGGLGGLDGGLGWGGGLAVGAVGLGTVGLGGGGLKFWESALFSG